MSKEIVIHDISGQDSAKALAESLPSCELVLRAEPGASVPVLEEYLAHREECREMFYVQPSLVLVTHGTGTAITRNNTFRHEHAVRIQSLMLLPAQFVHGCQPGSGSGFLCATFDPRELSCCIDELGLSSSSLDLRPQIGAQDDMLVQLMLSLRVAAAQGVDAHSRLFRECLTKTLAVRLIESSLIAGRHLERHESTTSLRRRLRPVIEYISEDPARDVGIVDLAKLAGMSPSHFMRCFKLAIGTTPSDFQRRKRVEVAARLMRSGLYSQQKAAEAAGFSSVQGLRKAYAKVMGYRLRRPQ